MTSFRGPNGSESILVSAANPLPVSSGAAGKTAATVPANISVSTSAVQILAANSARKALLIQNVHATNDLFLSFNATAPTTTNGIRVKAGETYTDEGYTGVVQGIASAAGTDVRYVEFS